MNFLSKIFTFFLSLFSVTPQPAAAAPSTSTAAQPAQTRYIAQSAALSLIKSINSTEFGNFFNPYDVMAVITIESSFDSYATRQEAREASVGLMQVLPSTAKDRGFTGTPDMLYDPRTNIKYGMRHLKWSYDQLKSKLGKAPDKALWIKSYNAGVGGALSYGGEPIYWDHFSKARAGYP